MSKVIGISFPDVLLQEIDSRRGDVSRSRYVWKILQKELNKEISKN
jgi:metal-responsive CopG/Arc/MetJ family transcriptional regulator